MAPIFATVMVFLIVFLFGLIVFLFAFVIFFWPTWVRFVALAWLTSGVGGIGNAQAVEINSEDRKVAGKIDLITSFLLFSRLAPGAGTLKKLSRFLPGGARSSASHQLHA